MVINIDGWVESTDRPNGMSPFGVGYRAVCNAASDVIAKGAKPTGMIISMTLDEKHWEQFENIIDDNIDSEIELQSSVQLLTQDLLGLIYLRIEKTISYS